MNSQEVFERIDKWVLNGLHFEKQYKKSRKQALRDLELVRRALIAFDGEEYVASSNAHDPGYVQQKLC